MTEERRWEVATVCATEIDGTPRAKWEIRVYDFSDYWREQVEQTEQSFRERGWVTQTSLPVSAPTREVPEDIVALIRPPRPPEVEPPSVTTGRDVSFDHHDEDPNRFVTYHIRSASDPGKSYDVRVDLEEAVAICPCPGFGYRRTCRHANDALQQAGLRRG